MSTTTRAPLRAAAAVPPSRSASHHDEQDSIDDMTVDLVMEMLYATQSESDHGPTVLTRDDVVAVLVQYDGDLERTVDDLLSQLAIRALEVEESAHSNQSTEQTTRLQWHELCSGLGLSECDQFFKLVETMPDAERDALLSTDGGFFQQLLLKVDEEELEERRARQAELGPEWDEDQDEDEDMHPIARLQRLFPDYQLPVIEDVYERHGFDLNATAVALQNIHAVSNVQSFAAIVKARKPKTLIKSEQAQQDDERYAATPSVHSLGHFPALPKGRAPSQKQQRKHRALGARPRTNNAHTHNVFRQKPNVSNAWGTGGRDGLELAAKLKLEQLEQLLPMIDRDVIRTTFYLSGCSASATEASLREIFHLPMPESPRVSSLADEEDVEVVDTITARNEHDVPDDATYAACRERVDHCWQALSDRYCAALESFNRNHHVIANDRVRAISRARQALRDAQYDAAHAFVIAHEHQIRCQQPLDLHGLTVLEAVRVAREVVDRCRQDRIRRCILICGVGNHSINNKARILTAIQLSMEKRRIAFRKEMGTLYVYPLRSTT